MSDPLSITASIIAITQAVQQIYIIFKSIKESKIEIKGLCEELFSLKGVLEHVQMQVSLVDTETASADDLPIAFGSPVQERAGTYTNLYRRHTARTP